MTWFKVDDKFHGSEEVMSIPTQDRAAAIGLWTLAGAWSSDHLKDGFVPITHLEQWGGTVELAEILVRAKLWVRVRKSGFQFRNWDKWQITREQVETAREREREKKAGWRAAKAAKQGDGPGVVPGDISRVPGLSPLSRPVPTRPDPTRPLKEDLSVGKSRGKTPAQDGFGNEPVDNMKPNLDRIHARLIDITPDDTKVEFMHAAMVSDEFLARAPSPPRMATSYVLSCITRHSNAVVNYIQTGRWSE